MANYTIIGGDNKEYGPVTEADVKQWIAEGRLNAESRVKAESDAEFRALAQFPEFASALKPQAAPGIIAPPISATVEDGPNWQAEVLAREPELKFGECLAAGWSFLGANAGFLAGAVVMTSVMNSLLVLIAVTVPLVGSLVMLCFYGVVMGGFYLACLRRLRGEAVSPTDVFSGFTVAFAQLLLTGLVRGLLTQVSFCCLILPGVYLVIAWFFSVLLVADKRMFFWTAMELSRKVATRVWFELFVLLAVAFLPIVLFQAFNLVLTGRFLFNLYDQAGQNFQQFAQSLQSQAGGMKKLTMQMTLIGQAVTLVNLFYLAGVVTRAYENLFGARKS